MICPKCSFEQPDDPECMRCGVIVSRYKGPILDAGARATPPPFAPGPLPPAPAIPPPPAGSGTVYAGPPPGSIAPVFSSFPAGPVFHGTFETGKILGEAFSVYFANFIPFLLLSTLALSPLLLFSTWASALPAADPTIKLIPSLTSIIQFLCTPIATAAITYGVYQQMRGVSPSLGTCLKVGLSSLFPLLGLVFVQGCAVGFASLLCLVPGIILLVRWAVAIPAKVEERVSVSDAMTRSTYLTDGYRWQVFCVLAVLFIIGFALELVLLVAFGTKGYQAGLALLLKSILAVATTGLGASASAVMYYRLRSVKESIDVDQISSVFA